MVTLVHVCSGIDQHKNQCTSFSHCTAQSSLVRRPRRSGAKASMARPKWPISTVISEARTGTRCLLASIRIGREKPSRWRPLHQIPACITRPLPSGLRAFPCLRSRTGSRSFLLLLTRISSSCPWFISINVSRSGNGVRRTVSTQDIFHNSPTGSQVDIIGGGAEYLRHVTSGPSNNPGKSLNNFPLLKIASDTHDLAS